MNRLLICVATVIAAAALFAGCQKKTEAPTVETAGTAARPLPPDTEIVGDAVRGLTLFNDASLGTTGKSCESCHPNGGQEGLTTEEVTTKPLLNVKYRYPGPFSMMPDAGDMTLEEVVNACVTGPVGGKAFIENGRDMADMIAYFNGLESE
jgi:cytochrome c